MWHALSIGGVLNLSSQQEARQYYELRRFIASNMDLSESIDNFLHTHSEDPRIVAIGKTAIAACILEAERGSHLTPPPKDVYPMTKWNGESWLRRFCTMAMTGILKSQVSSAFENLTLVTFNYDRCIELYLVDQIKAYLGIDEAAACEIVDAIEIIHVYGKVGRLPWQSGKGPDVPFGAKPHPELLNAVSKEIRTFTERLDQDDTHHRIEAAISMAELIVFSGFSFGTSNWEFLQNARPGPRKVAIAGVYKVSEPNQANIQQRLQHSLHPNAGSVRVHTCDKDFRGLLHDYSSYFE